MEIGQKLRKVRELKGFSQEYMASNLNVSQITYGRIETGQTKLDLNRLDKIATILEIDPLELLSFDEQFIFTKCKQSGKINSIHNNLQDKERDLYNDRIRHLETEIVFLRETIKSLERK